CRRDLTRSEGLRSLNKCENPLHSKPGQSARESRKAGIGGRSRPVGLQRNPIARETNRDMSENPDSETGFLEQLGQRVRTMRALRGMSRKVLAKVSGISERYIAQLESGKGN